MPYRQTKLTNVLKDALGGNCNTLLFACMWGESAHLEETISTLRLASRMMRVQNSTSAVEVVDPVKMVRKQERTIKELKQELLMHDALADRSGVAYVSRDGGGEGVAGWWSPSRARARGGFSQI